MVILKYGVVMRKIKLCRCLVLSKYVGIWLDLSSWSIGFSILPPLERPLIVGFLCFTFGFGQDPLTAKMFYTKD